VEIIGLLLTPVVLGGFIWLIITAFKKSSTWGIGVFIGPLVITIFSSILIQPSGIISILLISLIAFIPPSLFAYKYWERAKNPFLSYIISSALFLIISVSTLASLGDDTLESLITQAQQGAINEQDAAKRMRKLIQQLEDTSSLTEQEKLSMRTAQNIIKQVEINLSNDPEFYNRTDVEQYEQDIAMREAQKRKEDAKIKLQEKLNQRTTIEKIPTAKKPRTFPTIKKSTITEYIGSTLIIITKKGYKQKGLLIGYDETEDKLILEKKRKTGKLKFKIHMFDIKTIYLYIPK